MTQILPPCPQEKEIAAHVRSGRWPQASEPALRQHAQSCTRCSEMLLVSQAFQSARDSSSRQAPLGSPGLIWWRAQLRRRNEAVERLNKPITRAQIFALAINLFVAACLVVSQARHGLNWLGWLSGLSYTEFQQSLATRTSEFWTGLFLNQSWNLTLVLPTIAAVLLLSGVALYLALDSNPDKR